jgi:hypothetical protein
MTMTSDEKQKHVCVSFVKYTYVRITYIIYELNRSLNSHFQSNPRRPQGETSDCGKAKAKITKI